MLNIRQVGSGVFGSFMFQLAQSTPGVSVLPAFTRSSGLKWDEAVMGPSVEAVYICSPDAVHTEQAIACLAAHKHVLVEKPLTAFPTVAAAARASSAAFMVGFHRRHDVEFMRARAFVETQTRAGERPRCVVLDSRDPVPVDADASMAGVVLNSVCHDMDMMLWLLQPRSALLSSVEADPITNGVRLAFDLTLGGTHNPSPCSVVINYRKGNPTYVQQATIDGRQFGYDAPAPIGVTWPADSWAVAGPGMAQHYREAYRAQFAAFARLASAPEAPRRHEVERLLRGYASAFGLVAEVMGRLA